MFESEPKSPRMQPIGEHEEPVSDYTALILRDAREKRAHEIAALESAIHAIEEWEQKSFFEKLALIYEKPPVDGSLEAMYAKLRHLEEVAVFKEDDRTEHQV